MTKRLCNSCFYGFCIEKKLTNINRKYKITYSQNDNSLSAFHSFWSRFLSALSTTFFIAVVIPCVGQTNTTDSLLVKDIDYLKNGFVQYIQDTSKANIYANAYLARARKDNDTVQIANAYYCLSLIASDDQKLILYDTIISLTKNFRKEKFPTLAYHDKGLFFYNKRNFKKAFDNYILAIEYNNGPRKDHFDFLLNRSIAGLKNRIEENEDCLQLLKKSWKYIGRNNIRSIQPKIYLNTLFSLSDSFRKNSILDSANYYNSKGLYESLLLNQEKYYHNFVMGFGIQYYYEGNYNRAFDSLRKGLNYMIQVDDRPNMIVGYYFLGKVQNELNQIENAVFSFKNLDSVFQINGDILPETRDSYKYLINYYRVKKDLQNELLYLDKLIKIDSLLNDNFKFLSKNINKKFDTRVLLEKKESIIEELNNKNIKAGIILKISIAFLLILVCFSIFQIYRNKKFKNKFDKLMSLSHSNLKLEKQTIFSSIPKEKTDLDLDSKIIDAILLGLSKFESEEGYLEIGLSLSSLAVDLNTNVKYLSKVINHYKEDKFQDYLKKLRVNYAFNRLKDDSKFKNYTIKAIAEESGFNRSESFSKAFYKKYGIYPSFFVKNLKNSNR